MTVDTEFHYLFLVGVEYSRNMVARMYYKYSNDKYDQVVYPT